MRNADLTDMRFGILRALHSCEDMVGGLKYTCQCDCGNTLIIKASILRRGHKKSCGCLTHKGTPRDHTGKKFGRLTAISSTGNTNANGSYIWNFVCDCGNKVVREVGNIVFRVKTGASSSCRDCELMSLGDRGRTHGKSGSKVHAVWFKIKDRCMNPGNNDFNDYGAKGVKVHESWINNFQAFYEHIGDPPEESAKWSIDRIDNSKGYEPNNVRWATVDTQARNKTFQKNNTSGVKGVLWENKLHPNGKNSTLYAIAIWYDPFSGEGCKKCFSAKKFGKDEAFRMACELRISKLLEANENGAGYSHSHIYGNDLD